MKTLETSTTEALDTFFTSLRARVGQVMETLEPHQDPRPFAFFMRRDRGVNCYGLSADFFRDGRSKDLLAEFLARQAADDSAVAVAFISAGWMLCRDDVQSDEEFAALVKRADRESLGSMADEPGRCEVVFIHECRAGSGTMSFAKVQRQAGAAPTLGEWRHCGDLTMESRFVSALHPVLLRNYSRMNS